MFSPTFYLCLDSTSADFSPVCDENKARSTVRDAHLRLVTLLPLGLVLLALLVLLAFVELALLLTQLVDPRADLLLERDHVQKVTSH